MRTEFVGVVLLEVMARHVLIDSCSILLVGFLTLPLDFGGPGSSGSSSSEVLVETSGPCECKIWYPRLAVMSLGLASQRPRLTLVAAKVLPGLFLWSAGVTKHFTS